VPLAERMRYLLLYRFIGSAIALAGWWALPQTHVVAFGVVAGVTAAYVVVSVLAEALWRALRRRSHVLFGGTLLIDGIWLATTVYATGGVGSPLRSLILVHLVVVCLLVSFRTGIKIALWHSLLAIGVFHAQESGLLVGGGDVALGAPAFRELCVTTAMLWLLTLTTATFAAINERELRRRHWDLEALARLAFKLETTTDPLAVADALVGAVVEEFELTRALVAARETENDPLHVLAHAGAATVAPSPGEVRAGVLATAERREATQLLKRLDADADAWLNRLLPEAHNVIVVPLHAEGRTIGFLVGEHGAKRGPRVERRVVATIERFVSQSALALNNAWLLQRIQRLAACDGLTGVGNRRSFDEGLAREILRAGRSRRPLSLVMLDIDHFKKLNDTHGHHAGDTVLRRVGKQLSEECRSSDLVARYGGEEFAALLPDTDLEQAKALAERLRIVIAEETEELRVTASFGVASCPDHASTPAELVRAADAALYESKHRGRNRTTSY
jgi:diguanylate cyclase (GGDEF)-like protein